MSEQQEFNPYRFPSLESALAELARINRDYDLPEMITATGEWDVIPDRHLMQMIIERINEHLAEAKW